MALYATVGIPGSVLLSPQPLVALYWNAAFLSVWVVVGTIPQDRSQQDRVRQLMYLNWWIAAAAAVTVVAIGWDVILGARALPERGAMPGYGVLAVKPEIAGMTMVRSSGVGRCAAVVGLVSLTRLLRGSRFPALLWGVPLVCSLAVLFVYHSRTPIFGFLAGSIVVLLLCAGREPRALVVAALILLLVGVWIMGPPAPIAAYVARGQSPEDYYGGLTGRFHSWDEGWKLFKQSPLLGFGFHGDRLMLHWAHVHNSWLRALVQAGILGGLFFWAAMVEAWHLLVRALRRRQSLDPTQRLLLDDTGAVLAFLTVKTVPESSGAFFGVDWLLLAPLLAYLQILDQRCRVAAPQVRLAHRPHYAARPFYAPAAFHRSADLGGPPEAPR
jgi:O-antigen ligase